MEKEKNDFKEKKIGYVSLIGRPNTGKSTFINHLIGEKISISSRVPQTTRNKVLWIYNDEESQIIFFDTPWIHKKETAFNEAINSQALTTLKEASLVLYFIDSSRKTWEEENYIEKILLESNIPYLIVYTKCDISWKISEEKDKFCIASFEKRWFDALILRIKEFLPEWVPLYPEDYYTHQKIDFRISEIIREKIFFYTKDELPHSIFVWVEEIEDKPQIFRIIAYIYTETESQKYIIIGKNGSLLSKIGKEARLDLEDIFGKKVFLSLRVKVAPKWRKNENITKKIFEN